MLLKIVRECYFIGKEEVDSSNLFNSSTLFVTVKWVNCSFDGVFCILSNSII